MLSANFRFGPGLLIPKTESSITINGNQYHNDGPFHVSGWVVGIGVAVRYDFLSTSFFEPSIKGSYVDYNNVKLYESGRADHRFFSVQCILSLGINVAVGQDPLFGN